MTISEQLRESALWLIDPWDGMTHQQFEICCWHKDGDHQSMATMPDDDLRTFMLLVAEALE